MGLSILESAYVKKLSEDLKSENEVYHCLLAYFKSSFLFFEGCRDRMHRFMMLISLKMH